MSKSDERIDENIMFIRDRNMQDWKEEDFLFYESFLNNTTETTSTEQKDSSDDELTTYTDRAWKSFQQGLKSGLFK